MGSFWLDQSPFICSFLIFFLLPIRYVRFTLSLSVLLLCSFMHHTSWVRFSPQSFTDVNIVYTLKERISSITCCYYFHKLRSTNYVPTLFNLLFNKIYFTYNNLFMYFFLLNTLINNLKGNCLFVKNGHFSLIKGMMWKAHNYIINKT